MEEVFVREFACGGGLWRIQVVYRGDFGGIARATDIRAY